MTAIYARQSVDRADSISVEQQIEICRYETRGEAFTQYSDRGYSGKDTNRPGLTQMMNDISEGQIDTVIVYRLDRISRSILDFSNMIEFFGRYGVKFISATEKFDTSSPMGNAMLNICIVFAQLERETIQKRVADAYYSRCRKSLYMGGPLPYGFRKVPAVIDGIHTSMYEAADEEAETVKLIYEMYSQPDTSYGDVIKKLNALGIRKRGSDWARPRIRDILVNPIYVKADLDVYDFFVRNGADIADPPSAFTGENGCYSYKNRSEKKKKSSGLCGIQIVAAPHKGIIDSEIWLRCREKCMSRNQVIPSQKAKNSWLCGKIKCGNCGHALTVKRFSTRNSRYLMCSERMNSGTCCGAGTLYADEIEEIVSAEINRKLAKLRILPRAESDVTDIERSGLGTELAKTDDEIKVLLERVGEADNALFRYINERINALDRRRNELNERIKAAEQKKYADEEEDIDMWSALSFEDKRRAADILIKVICAADRKLTIQWRI